MSASERGSVSESSVPESSLPESSLLESAIYTEYIFIIISGSACSTVGVHSQAWSTSVIYIGVNNIDLIGVNNIDRQASM
jgi:hypothetical protein